MSNGYDDTDDTDDETADREIILIKSILSVRSILLYLLRYTYTYTSYYYIHHDRHQSLYMGGKNDLFMHSRAIDHCS
jgi:hypothetical protein